ncbi:MAG: helix-turn-helix domain-containing protein [Pseudomonadota bacterium]
MQPKFTHSGKRSVCPVNVIVEIVGDQWSFLILRDILLLQRSRYSEFRDADEGVATNILAKRLKHLVDHGLIEKHQDPADGRGSIYLPTDRALDLIPVLLAMIAWSDTHQSNAKKYPELMAIYAADPSRAETLLKARAQALWTQSKSSIDE